MALHLISRTKSVVVAEKPNDTLCHFASLSLDRFTRFLYLFPVMFCTWNNRLSRINSLHKDRKIG